MSDVTHISFCYVVIAEIIKPTKHFRLFTEATRITVGADTGDCHTIVSADTIILTPDIRACFTYLHLTQSASETLRTHTSAEML